MTARARLGREADLTATGVGPASTSGTIARLFGPPGRAFVTRLGRLLERRQDETLALQLRQAGYVDVTPDEYRTRVAVHGLAAVRRRRRRASVSWRCTPRRPRSDSGSAARSSARRDCAGGSTAGIADRRERIRLELYTVNQLLAMHVRTGAGPVQATAARRRPRCRARSSRSSPRCSAAMRNGVAEPEAFRRAAELTPEPAAARTYKLFAAGAERGVDLADGLRALSEDLRDARREEIRQTATKRRAAMLVPTIAVLAPVMLLFIAAPLPSIVFGSR